MTEDRTAFRRRMVISLCLAVAINEIAIGLLHTNPPPQEEQATATRVVIERARPTPSPTPPPTPRPTPRATPTPHQTPPPHVVTLAAVAQRAAPKAALPKREHAGGAPSRRARVTAAHPRSPANPNGTHGSAAGIAGAGSGSGAGAGSAAGGQGGSGNGTGGNGTGGYNADTPCNDWYLNVRGPARSDHGQMHETVVIEIRTIGGQHVSAQFPYDFVYPNDAADPWSLRYLNMPDGDPRVPEPRIQFPPDGFDRSTLSPVLKIVLSKATPDGLTTLPECPGGDGRTQSR